MAFKRSQLEDVLCRVHVAHGTQKSTILVRIRRLLDIDRTLRVKRGADRNQRHAFFSERRPGTGQESRFQEYEIFALDLGLLLAVHGVPQVDIVEILRNLRPQLEREHRRYVDKNVAELAAPPGVGPTLSTEPVFLAVTQGNSKRPALTKSGLTAELLRGREEWLERFLNTEGITATFIEFSSFPNQLHEELKKTEPRKKGRR